MKKFGILTAIQETLHPPGSLFRWSESASTDSRKKFSIAKKFRFRKSTGGTLVSASIFSPLSIDPPSRLPAKVDYHFFSRRILPGPPEKYYLPLLRRREWIPDATLRIYLSPRLSLIVPWLQDLGFDEVFAMADQGADMAPGMLWRYLPIAEKSHSWVVCIGIDDQGLQALVPEFLVPNKIASVSLHPPRFWMPFAGPCAFAPAWMPEDVDVPAAMAGFLDESKTPDIATYRGQILNRASGPKSRFADAAWLTLAFWNRVLLDSKARFFDLGNYEFEKVNVAPVNLQPDPADGTEN